MGHIVSLFFAPIKRRPSEVRSDLTMASGGGMSAKATDTAERARMERIRALAQRCRDLSEMTAVPEVTRELVSIADELENEAELAARD
jgi:hypothetical protein